MTSILWWWCVFAVVVMAEMYKVNKVAIVVKVDPSMVMVVVVDVDMVVDVKTSKVEVIVQSPLGVFEVMMQLYD